MIIVEGPDGAGKSTLVTRLSEHFGLPIAERVVSKDTEAMIPLKPWVEQNVARGWQATIFDRHRLISEPIYGSVMRKTFEPGFDNFEWLFSMYYMLYNHCHPLIIYCLPPYEVVRDNLEGDEDNTAVVHKIRRVYAQYVAKAASDATLHHALVYNYYDPTSTASTPLGRLFTQVENALAREAHV